jgi:hypothetical protein
LNVEIISLPGIADGNSHQELSTVAALMDSSDKECHIFEPVRQPQENACSTSVDVAISLNMIRSSSIRIGDHIPGADKKFKDILDNGCPVNLIAVHQPNPSSTLVSGGVISHPSIGSISDIEL